MCFLCVLVALTHLIILFLSANGVIRAFMLPRQNATPYLPKRKSMELCLWHCMSVKFLIKLLRLSYRKRLRLLTDESAMQCVWAYCAGESTKPSGLLLQAMWVYHQRRLQCGVEHSIKGQSQLAYCCGSSSPAALAAGWRSQRQAPPRPLRLGGVLTLF